jgi:hypothetical protein
MGLHDVTGIALLYNIVMYMNFVRQETRLFVSTAWYEEKLTFLYVDDVRTSKETPMGLHGVTGIALLQVRGRL